MTIVYDTYNMTRTFPDGETPVYMGGSVRTLMNQLESRLGTEYADKAVIGRHVQMFSDYPGKRIYWTHNRPWDVLDGRSPPELRENYFLKNDVIWESMDNIVFASRWQRQQYINWYNFSHSSLDKLVVIPHGSEPITPQKSNDVIRLIYTSAPNKGLGLLYSAFTQVASLYSNVELDVYSSWSLYTGDDHSLQIGDSIIESCKAHPKINYHDSTEHSLVREGLGRSHIFVYPSTFPEIACLSLIEAMSAECICIHPNGGGLSETAGSKTFMYQTPEYNQQHVEVMRDQMIRAIESIRAGKTDYFKLSEQKQFIDSKHNWDTVMTQWKALIDA